MNNRISIPRHPRPKLSGMTDEQRVTHFRSELAKRGGLTAHEWDEYNAAWKRFDPKGFEEDKQRSYKRIDMENAKKRLSVAELEQIIAEKEGETVAISGAQLTTDKDHVVVSLEIDGKLVEVIREYCPDAPPISHFVHPTGIRAAIEKSA